MSSYSLNTILKSCVSEQAYLPLRSPVRAWVCKVESKGFWENLTNQSAYTFLRFGFLLRSLFARLRKTLSGSILLIINIHNGLNKFLRRGADYGIRVLFGFQYSFYQFFSPAISVNEVSRKIFKFMELSFRKHREHFLDIFDFVCSGIHRAIISQEAKEKANGHMDFIN